MKVTITRDIKAAIITRDMKGTKNTRDLKRDTGLQKKRLQVRMYRNFTSSLLIQRERENCS